MLLRRITAHIKKQNWFAVGLDFVIVVVGVLFALMTEQWLRTGQQKIDLESAERAINADILQNLFNVKEILALAPCRQERTQMLSALLEEDQVQWAGLPWDAHPGAFGAQLPEVLPTPFRHWGSRVWDAEMQNGTFAVMDSGRRRALDVLFASTKLAQDKQHEIFEVQSRLKILALAKNISADDRTRYLENLHAHDQQAGFIERVATQTLAQINAIGFERDTNYIEEFSDYIPVYNASRQERYGQCFVPFSMPFLDDAGVTARGL